MFAFVRMKFCDGPSKRQVRPGAEVLGTRVLEYIFEIHVLVEIMVMYSYSCSMYPDSTSISEYILNMIL